LARTDYYAPLVVIQILTGIALGSGVLGAFIPEVHAALFSPHLRRVSGAGLAGGWLGVDWICVSAHPSVIHDRGFESLKDCAASAALGLRASLSGRDRIAISLGLARPQAIRNLGF